MSGMNTEQCKELIMKVMNELITKVGLNAMAVYRQETGSSLQDVLDTKKWKRTRKWGSAGNVSREFSHMGFRATVVLREVINTDGTLSVEIEMGELPKPLQEATKDLKDLDLPGDQTARRVDKPSMTEGPKPEGFGAFA
ncbi:hypothetical protein CNR34_00124 [Pseudomonas phage nickie]|uniref:Uncharacterized protein n=1 Tax=Pseudomonas phage nickie TaxID=2048977 RepID=A0A2H4P7B2_9CAUD|nr:hypothetical protein FDJ16_gp041 [Pseudomonas phage nickie]ATW58057.1 hypothetical protein CNR34_00124 [Pseudomonas phage nickie]